MYCHFGYYIVMLGIVLSCWVSYCHFGYCSVILGNILSCWVSYCHFGYCSVILGIVLFSLCLEFCLMFIAYPCSVAPSVECLHGNPSGMGFSPI